MSGERKECGVLSKGAVEKIAEHYRHAVKKHPYFCDRFWCEVSGINLKEDLLVKRALLKLAMLGDCVSTDLVLSCEIAEVFDAYASGDTAAAVAECYDCIAVQLRMVDVLEGRQKLGKPDSAKKEEAE